MGHLLAALTLRLLLLCPVASLTALLATGQTPGQTSTPQKPATATALKPTTATGEQQLKDALRARRACEEKLAEWDKWRANNWNAYKNMTNDEVELHKQIDELEAMIRNLMVAAGNDSETIHSLRKQVEKFSHDYEVVKEEGGTWRFDKKTGEICLLLGNDYVLKKNADSICK
jgi:hypothetical protein